MNRSRKKPSRFGADWPVNRRILFVSLAVAALIALTALVAVFIGRSEQTHTAGSPTATAHPAPSSAASKPAAGAGPVASPPRIADPLAYAKAAATMLWSYDARRTTRDQQLAGMQAWMTKETRYADWASVTSQVADPLLWGRLADNGQYATAAVTESHFPAAFKAALAKDPAALNEAHVYAVTVTGKQQLAWKGGGGGAEDRSVTLAVQCRPAKDCTLAALAPQVAP